MVKRAAGSVTCPESKASKRTQIARTPKLPLPLYTASVKELAEANTDKDGASAADVDSAILLRIKKCLDRANHPGTAELEVKATFRLASRLMGQYNMSQAEVLAHEPAATHMRYAGQSVVSIKRVDGDRSKAVKHQSYVDSLCHAMGNFFDCKFYSTSTLFALELTFYGIAENTVAAAMAFEMAYNLVTEWARPHRGARCKNSYCLGASDELNRMARKEKGAEEADAKNTEAEAIALKSKLDEVAKWVQLCSSVPPESCSSPKPAWAGGCGITNTDGISQHADSGMKWSDWLTENGIGEVCNRFTESSAFGSGGEGMEPDFKFEPGNGHSHFASLDEDIAKLIKRERPEESPEIYSPLPRHAPLPAPFLSAEQCAARVYAVKMEEVVKATPEVNVLLPLPWASHTQLIFFRATATKIADEYLRHKGVKIRHRSGKLNVVGDQLACDQSTKDGEKINVRRDRIEEMSGKRIRNSA